MNAWKTSPWSIRCIVIAMAAYIVIAPALILNDYFGSAVKEGFLLAMGVGKARQRCVFDRNELGPMGAHGQWWWDIYKCTDGTERRELVAGPRG